MASRSIAACVGLLLALMARADEGSIVAGSPTRIDPAQPTAFERVTLRFLVDSCAWNPASARISWTGTRIRVTMRPNECFAPGDPKQVEMQLGAFPAGDYEVEVALAGGGPATTVLAFSVRDPVEPAVVPLPPRPLVNHSGMWWSPQEPGWGLSLHQSALHAMFGALFVYDAKGEPQWYTIQGGRWTSSTRWTGKAFRTTGTPFAAATYLTYTSLREAGSATLEFAPDLGPGVSAEGHAALSYTLDGTTATKLITRMPY